MKIPMFQIDAFTDKVFGGNPAAVCVLGDWLEDRVMQAIAMENNLSETAFLIKRTDHYDLRWFTPAAEIDLAGHPTLAAAFTIFEILKPGSKEVRFETNSGTLTVTKEGDLLAMNFPATPATPCEPPEALIKGLGVTPREVLLSRDHMVVLESEADVLAVQPDFNLLTQLDSMGVMVTAPGDNSDFVSRFFAPKMGIQEDPVTGSAHCTLIPYWAQRLGKSDLTAIQVSQRRGLLSCRDMGERVQIAGQAVLFFSGYIYL
jgi:PhzF family phenazine biosynthesis protein